MTRWRLTPSVFRDLAFSMTGFGLLVGLAFPYAVHRMGVPEAYVLTVPFHAYCLAAGLLVGAVNVTLFRAVVRERFRALAGRLKHIQETLEQVRQGERAGCPEQDCHLPVDSADELGEASACFNQMVNALAATLETTDAAAQFNRKLMGHLDGAELAREALGMLAVWTGAQGGAILLVREGELELIASRNLAAPESLSTNPALRRVCETQTEALLASPEGVILDAVLARFTPRQVLVQPLSVRGAAIGVLVLGAADAFAAESLRRVRLLREPLALAMQNAIAYEQLERLAALDPLTGCYNRRFGLARLREEYERAVRRQLPLGVIVFDLDHFKAINDTYGHLVGDRVLVRLTQCARQVLRQGDLLIRYGGEEFVAVLPFAAELDTEATAERLRRQIAESPVVHGAQAIRLTVSAGVAALPESLASSETDLIQQADQALYSAKQSGRNRVLRASAILAASSS